MRLVQDFLNSDLSETKHLRSWLARHRLLPESTKLTEVRSLFWANSGGKLNEDAVERLDQAAQGAKVQGRFDRDGNARFESPAQSIEGALGYLLSVVVVARQGEDWPRYKLCAAADCGAAFYDFSKSGKGRWCKVRCGDKMRARAYRKTEKYKSRPSRYIPRS